jgi:hypothetical protein
MKTILVVYTDKITPLSNKEVATLKKYAFNTASEVNFGSIISSPEYTTNMVVIKVLDESFKYYNSATGELSNTFTSTLQWEVRTLAIRNDEESVIYGKLL